MEKAICECGGTINIVPDIEEARFVCSKCGLFGIPYTMILVFRSCYAV